MQTITEDEAGPLAAQPDGPPPRLAPGARSLIGSVTSPGGSADLFDELAAAAAELAADDQAAEAGQVLTFADPAYEPLETVYSWDKYWPRGPSGVVVVAAQHESGKGLLGANAAAAITTGSLMPGETGDPARIAAGLPPKAPADVVMIADEDDPNEDLAWRLRAAYRGTDTEHQGADLSRVFNFAELPGGVPFEMGTTLTDPGHIPDLLAFLRRLRRTCLNGHVNNTGDRDCGRCDAPLRDPQVVIIDPLDNLVKGSLRSEVGAVRLIRRLRFVARKAGVTIVLVHHTRKSGTIGGSQKIMDVPRRVYRIDRDEAAPELKVFSRAKSNGAKAPPLKYRIIEDGHDSRIEWASAEQVTREEDSWRPQGAREPVPGVVPPDAPPGPYGAAWCVSGPDGRAVHHDLGVLAGLAEAQAECQLYSTAPLAWHPSPRVRPGWLLASAVVDGKKRSYVVAPAPGK